MQFMQKWTNIFFFVVPLTLDFFFITSIIEIVIISILHWTSWTSRLKYFVSLALFFFSLLSVCEKVATAKNTEARRDWTLRTVTSLLCNVTKHLRGVSLNSWQILDMFRSHVLVMSSIVLAGGREGGWRLRLMKISLKLRKKTVKSRWQLKKSY